MPSKVTIRVQGAAEIEAALKELGAAAANRIARSALTRSATPIVKRAKELVPVDTGALRSIGSSGIIPAPPKNRLGLRPRPQGVKW
jgi:Bacteriophage HK97-gp10, putative tail-component